ncbi:hypothetical protein BaRGS_00037262 [Batillaria attramentaria]|uniref:Uncharacterized protein n=1 Tax=Batillaria attramentaria TaxID=370345 RepID=A0ABD0J9A8_9CAEN
MDEVEVERLGGSGGVGSLSFPPPAGPRPTPPCQGNHTGRGGDKGEQTSVMKCYVPFRQTAGSCRPCFMTQPGVVVRAR